MTSSIIQLGTVVHGSCPSDVNINDDKFLVESYLSTKKSPGTKTMYEMELRKFSEWLKKPLVLVTKWEMLAYNKWLTDNYDNEKTIQRIYSTLRNFYKWLIQMEVIEKNPTEGPITPLTPINNPNERILTKSELMAIIEVAQKRLRDRALIGTLITTGLRNSEICNLNWNDIRLNSKGDFVARVIRKGNEERFIPLRQDTVVILLEYRRRPLTPKDNSPVFGVLYRGEIKKITTAGIRGIVSRLTKEAGIEREVTPHWLRHTYASLALAGGAGLRDVQNALNHKSIKTTEMYLHAMQSNVADYIDIKIE